MTTPSEFGFYTEEDLTIPDNEIDRNFFLKDRLEEHAKFINGKDSGIYEEYEYFSNKTFFGATPQVKRSVYRKSFSFGAIAAGATLNIAHNITFSIFTMIYGTVITDVVDYRPIPYVDAVLVTNQIAITIDAVNINITNGATAPNVTTGIIVLEYLKI